MNSLAVGLGGSLGAMTRYFLAELFPSNDNFPYVTMLINWSGSLFFALLFVKLLAKRTWIKLGATTGFLEGFTTFSTFSFEVVQLFEERRVKTALIYAGSSCVISIFFAYIGYTIKKSAFAPF